jgi:hypothetical protein
MQAVVWGLGWDGQAGCWCLALELVAVNGAAIPTRIRASPPSYRFGPVRPPGPLR